jgi:hypothetical protein
MNINGEVYSLLLKTGHLPGEIQNKIKHQSVAKWIKVLGNDPVGLAHLFNAIVHVKGWERNNNLKNLAENTKKEIKKIGLDKNKAAKKIYEAAKHHILKDKTVLPTPVVHVDGIANPQHNFRTSCLISLIQLFRTTNHYDSILQANGAIRAKNNVERGNLIELRNALRGAVEKIRNNQSVNENELKQLEALFGKFIGIFEPFYAIRFLQDHLGNTSKIESIVERTYSYGTNNFRENKKHVVSMFDLNPCEGHGSEESQSTTQLFQQHMHSIIDDTYIGLPKEPRVVERERATGALVRIMKSRWAVEAFEEERRLRRAAEEALIAKGLPHTPECISAYMQNVQTPYLQKAPLVEKKRTITALPSHLSLTNHKRFPWRKYPIDLNLDLSKNISPALQGEPNNPHYTLQNVICSHFEIDGCLLRHTKYTYFFRDMASNLWTRYDEDTVTKGLSWQQIQEDIQSFGDFYTYLPVQNQAPQHPRAAVPQQPIVNKPQVAKVPKQPADKEPKVPEVTHKPVENPPKAEEPKKHDGHHPRHLHPTRRNEHHEHNHHHTKK